jgi:hypothetical protein
VLGGNYDRGGRHYALAAQFFDHRPNGAVDPLDGAFQLRRENWVTHVSAAKAVTELSTTDLRQSGFFTGASFSAFDHPRPEQM